MKIVPTEIAEAAQAAQATYAIPASVQIAQWALESGWGAHVPPGSNNPFGIKAIEGEPGVAAQTREWVARKGQYISVVAQFRKFDSLAEAFDQHASLLAYAAVYAPCRALLPDPVAFAMCLTGKYATDPNYGKLLCEIISDNDLTQYD